MEDSKEIEVSNLINWLEEVTGTKTEPLFPTIEAYREFYWEFVDTMKTKT